MLKNDSWACISEVSKPMNAKKKEVYLLSGKIGIFGTAGQLEEARRLLAPYLFEMFAGFIHYVDGIDNQQLYADIESRTTIGMIRFGETSCSDFGYFDTEIAPHLENKNNFVRVETCTLDLRSIFSACAKISEVQDAEPSLLNLMHGMTDWMRKPDPILQIALVDDEDGLVRGIAAILRCWPNIELHEFYDIRQFNAASIGPADIILLDECLVMDQSQPGIYGSEIATELTRLGHNGVFCSISSSFKTQEIIPGGYHFSAKGRSEYETTAYLFIMMMNAMIDELQSRRSNKIDNGGQAALDL